jgi:hypothetical protein
VLNVVRRARAALGDSLVAAMNNGLAWKRLVREVAEVVRIMPLWKLQTVGREHLDFLYANSGAGNTITLRPGVAFCFRKFHPLISDIPITPLRLEIRRPHKRLGNSLNGLTTALIAFIPAKARVEGCSRWWPL